MFLLNLPLAAVVITVTVRHVPETRNTSVSGGFDIAGAALAALALAGLTYALIQAPGQPTGQIGAQLAAGVGVLAAAGFWLTERRRARWPGRIAPMLPLDVFRSSQFRAINLITFLVYGAFSGLLFLLVLQLQVVAGFSPLAAGSSLLPVTLLMLGLSARSGALAERVGPRRVLTVGLLCCATGMALMARIGPHASYLSDVLPAAVVYGLGLALTVAPLTATVLASARCRRPRAVELPRTSPFRSWVHRGHCRMRRRAGNRSSAGGHPHP